MEYGFWVARAESSKPLTWSRYGVKGRLEAKTGPGFFFQRVLATVLVSAPIAEVCNASMAVVCLAIPPSY